MMGTREPLRKNTVGGGPREGGKNSLSDLKEKTLNLESNILQELSSLLLILKDMPTIISNKYIEDIYKSIKIIKNLNNKLKETSVKTYQYQYNENLSRSPTKMGLMTRIPPSLSPSLPPSLPNTSSSKVEDKQDKSKLFESDLYDNIISFYTNN